MNARSTHDRGLGLSVMHVFAFFGTWALATTAACGRGDGEPPQSAAAAVQSLELATPPRDTAPAPELSVRQQRMSLLDEIRQSGTVDDKWVDAATANFMVWHNVATPEVGSDRIRLSDVECYRRGCFATATYRSTADWLTWRAKVPVAWLRSGSWRGGRGVTGPDELPSGQVVSAWVLRIPKTKHNGEK